MHTNKDLTSYMKGFAILSVISGHFSQRFMPEQIMSFGSHFIAIFFILSGYGLYFSLIKQEKEKKLCAFYLKRFSRIYPLYWIAFVIDFIFDSNIKTSDSLFIDFFLLHFTDPPRVWFLHALIPCYVLAPAIFELIKKTKNKFIVYMSIFFLILNGLFFFIGIPKIKCWMYHGTYLNHIFLFCTGMYLPILHNNFKVFFTTKTVILSFLLMIFSFTQTSYLVFDFLKYTPLPTLLFSFSTILFTYIFMFSEIHPPFFKKIKKIGSYTYSLFIFEGMYATFLSKVHILEGKNYTNALWFLLFFPLFLLLCGSLEEIINHKLNFPKAFMAIKANLSSS